MARSETLLGIAVGVLVLLTGSAALAAGPGSFRYKSDDGVLFVFGMSNDFYTYYTDELDFDTSQENGTIGAGVPSITSGYGQPSDDNDFGPVSALAHEIRLMFSLEKGRLSLFTMLEWDGVFGGRAIDHNNPNMERVALNLDIPEFSSTLTVGSELYQHDPLTGLIYFDDDPGILVAGGKGNINWVAGYFKRRENSGQAGDTGFRHPQSGDGTDHDIFTLRLGYRGRTQGRAIWYLEPSVLVQTRGFGQGFPEVNSEQHAVYLGLGASFETRMFKLAAGIAHHRGEIFGLTSANGVQPFGRDRFDISSFAVHLRGSLRLGRTKWWPLGGVEPYFSYEWDSGDDDPNDDDLTGYVPVTTSNGLREYSAHFLSKSVSGFMPVMLGALTLNFGFNTAAASGGPFVGGITEFERGDNPGFHHFQIGLQGKLAPRWGIYTRIVHIRYAETATIGRGPFRFFRPVGKFDPDENLGWGFDFNVDYLPAPNLTLTPFFSVWFPGQGAEDVIGKDVIADHAVMAGFRFYGIF